MLKEHQNEFEDGLEGRIKRRMTRIIETKVQLKNEIDEKKIIQSDRENKRYVRQKKKNESLKSLKLPSNNSATQDVHLLSHSARDQSKNSNNFREITVTGPARLRNHS